MTLFGALSSGVSGLSAQSSAIGAISDNITNLSTIGYKSTQVDFQTLVTKQTSATFFSAGGVQSRPRQDTGTQGLLASSTSATDIALAGSGFFVVNEAAKSTIADEYLFTRAGSFFQDNEGFLRNTAGYFLQAWPTDPSGVVVPSNTSLSIANQNVISRDFLESVNLSRVGGTAKATSNISIGANLPSNDAAGTSRRTDVQFFDTLGNAVFLSVDAVKTEVDNNWDVIIEPPAGTAVITLEDATSPIPLVYDSIGQLEFITRPAAGATVVIDGISYINSATATESATAKRWLTSGNTTISDDVADLVTAVILQDSDFEEAGGRIVVKTDEPSTILFKAKGNDDIVVNPAFVLDANGVGATKQTTSFTVKQQAAKFAEETQFHFPQTPTDADQITINGITYTFTTGQAADATGANTLIFNSNTNNPANIATTVTDLRDAIIANDPEFTAANVRVRSTSQDSNTAAFTADTLVLKSKSDGTDFSVAFTATLQAGGAKNLQDASKTPANLTTPVTVGTDYAVVFNSDGIPSAFNVNTLDIRGFTNGANDMTGTPPGVDKIKLDLGTVKEANGLTQFGGSFTPVFISQNGSQFGTFAGVSITEEGLVTALFDNGETRPVFQIPIATFVNVNQLGSRSGNVWNATQQSGDPTLRIAASGSAGSISQTTLEQSTVDIGQEFTKMIVVQRAFSAASKIITTADEMLEELLRTKR
jgi:flagellar hook protein FlgE